MDNHQNKKMKKIEVKSIWAHKKLNRWFRIAFVEPHEIIAVSMESGWLGSVEQFRTEFVFVS